MPLHVYSFTNLETNKWNQQSMLWRNSKECVVSENSCSKNFVNFEEKHPREITLLNKVAGYVTCFLGVFFWEIYEFFRTASTRNTREYRLLQLVVTGKCFDQNIFFKKYLIRFFSFMFWYSMACVPRDSVYNRCLKKAYCYILNFYF